MTTSQEALLREYGLKENEIKIVISLVQKGELTAYRIAKITGIHRSTTYDILERLIEEGFVSKNDLNKHSLYFVNDISSIISHIKDKENILMSLIPIFQEISQDKKQLVKIYRKVSGQKEFLYRLFQLAEKGLIKHHYLVGNSPASTISSNMFIDTMTKKFRKDKFHKNVDYKGIWDLNLKNEEILKTFNLLGENRFLKGLPSKATLMIYGNYIAFAYTEEYPIIVEINNEKIANEMKAYFNFLWNIAN